jgi:hypothetical protein
MFSGGNRSITPVYVVKDDSLKLRPYNQALNAYTEKVCTDIGQSGSDTCLFETRTAFDCLLRNKVRKFGDITDNVGACKHHIANMKQALGHGSTLDKLVDELHHMRQSFV